MSAGVNNNYLKDEWQKRMYMIINQGHILCVGLECEDVDSEKKKSSE